MSAALPPQQRAAEESAAAASEVQLEEPPVPSKRRGRCHAALPRHVTRTGRICEVGRRGQGWSTGGAPQWEPEYQQVSFSQRWQAHLNGCGRTLPGVSSRDGESRAAHGQWKP